MERTQPMPTSGVVRKRSVVSVVIPCYNYGQFLGEALSSVLHQEGVDVEAIIVDDASTDGSALEAQRFAALDSRVTAILHTANAGHIGTYNDGLSRCTGDYVLLLSADDLVAPGALGRAVALFEARPNVGLVYGRAPAFVSRPRVSRRPRPTWTVWRGTQWSRAVCRGGTNVIANPEAILRRDVVERVGGYDAGLPHTADLAFWLSAASYADVGHINGPDQAYYRVHGANMHLDEDEFADLSERAEMFDRLYGPTGSLRNAELHATARRAIAAEAIRRAVHEIDLGRGARPLVQHYVALAYDQDVSVEGTPEWAALRRREAAASSQVASAVLSASGRTFRRISREVRTWGLRRTGVHR